MAEFAVPLGSFSSVHEVLVIPADPFLLALPFNAGMSNTGLNTIIKLPQWNMSMEL
jgi:hypothetical protein